MGGKNSYESIKKYQDKAYDRVVVRTKKGEKEMFQEYAASIGLSLNQLFVQSVKEKMERERNV